MCTVCIAISTLDCVYPLYINLSNHSGMKLVRIYHSIYSACIHYTIYDLICICHYDESVKSAWLGCAVTSSVTG